MMTPRRLLKSCAIPPDNRPIASIFCAIRSCRSSTRFSVTSSANTSKYAGAPFSSLMLRPEHRTVIGVPSCRFHSISTSLASSVPVRSRSEEHTSELQSPCNLVCRLLLEKKKTCPRRSTSCTIRRHHSRQAEQGSSVPPHPPAATVQSRCLDKLRRH